ncbi:MAG: YIP1 family protein [Syntrophales bacterium]|nr:YIP1 family protein [Syntrophales bacterium]
MLLNWLWDIVTVDGKIAASIREKRSLLLSPLIVFTAAQIHGLTMFYFRSVVGADQINAAEAGFYVVFGYMAVIASQLGIALLLWGIGKVLGGAASRFIDVFIAVGYAFLPYGILLAANTYHSMLQQQEASFSTLPLPVLIMLAALAYFIYQLTKVLHLLTGFPMKRAVACVVVSFVFIISFIYLFGY